MKGRTPSEQESDGGALDYLLGSKITRPQSARKRVYGVLREGVFAGRIPPGSSLSEARVAEYLGVSRTPVREAFHLLEREGLLESVPRVGYRVHVITLAEIAELCEIRAANESLAVRWATERMTDEHLRSLQANAMQQEEELAAGRTGALPDLDASFHDILVRASGSPRLQELCQDLRRHMLLFRVGSLYRVETALIAVEGHKQILASLWKRDAEGAVLAVCRHLSDAGEGIRRDAFDLDGVHQRPPCSE